LACALRSAPRRGTFTRLVLWQSLRLVGVGLIIGAGLAWGLATLLMSMPAAARIGGIVNVFDPLASIPALRAARIDPIATLRQE
jgi:NhaP-type Na+/H+ or K+/H+ antiporter